MSLLGDRLKTLRQSMSQAQVARELGMKQPQYARYESGACSPSVEAIIKLCEVFCCSADDILGTHRNKSSVSVNGSGNVVANGAHAVAIANSAAPGEMAVCRKCQCKRLYDAVAKAQKTITK